MASGCSMPTAIRSKHKALTEKMAQMALTEKMEKTVPTVRMAKTEQMEKTEPTARTASRLN